MTDAFESIDLDELRRLAEAELEKPKPPFLNSFDSPADVDESNLDDLTQHAFDAGTDWADWHNARTVLALLDRAESAERVIERIKTARSNHPACELYEGDDAVSCGWKSTVLDIDAALTEGDKQ